MSDVIGASGESGSSEVEVLRRRLSRVERLYEVGNIMHSTLDPNRALELIVEQSVRLTRATSGSVVLINPTTGYLEILAAAGLPGEGRRLRLRVGQGITGWVAQTGKAAVVRDVSSDNRYVQVRSGVRSELAVPLLVGGEVRGVINVDSTEKGAFDDDDLDVLTELSKQAAGVVVNTWHHEQVRLRSGLFESLLKVGQTINSALHVEEALKLITREACQLMRAKLCSLLLVDESGGWLDLKASHGAGKAYMDKPRLSMDESLVGGVVRRKKAVQVDNVLASGSYQNLKVARRDGLVALLSVPLVFGDRCLGVLNIYKGEAHYFSNDEIGVLSALADLSSLALEKARLYERIMDVEEQLRQQEKLSVLGLVAAEVAHEIRNPLTVLKMLYHSLDLRFAEDDPRSRDAQIMGEKMDQLNAIVERILDFARTGEPQRKRLSLGTLLEELDVLTRHKLRQQGIDVVRCLPPDLPEIMADPVQLNQAFLNLILNAAEAMPQGGRIEIEAGRASIDIDGEMREAVQLEFRDNGAGIPQERQTRLFKSLFETTKSGGTGLGLAVVSRIVEAHHGEISVESRPECGTTFRLVLPVCPEEDIAMAGGRVP
jgi:signal transduction histidine kinase